MITCKEDLVGFYVLRSDKEVFELFMDKCEEFGLIWRGGQKPRHESSKEGEAVTIWREFNYRITHYEEEYYLKAGLKKLTLSDFKPTRTKYVKVEDSIFDLKAEFEAGGLYYSEFSMGKKFVQIGAGAEHLLMGNLSSGNLYRKVEREVTWQDEIKRDYTLKFNGGKVSMKTGAFDVDVFIEMCHKVYHLTK